MRPGSTKMAAFIWAVMLFSWSMISESGSLPDAVRRRDGRIDSPRAAQHQLAQLAEPQHAAGHRDADAPTDRGSSGTVPNATLSKPRCTTATCSSTDSAIAPHSHGLTNRWRKALMVSERALKQLNSWANTSTVKPAVRALSQVVRALDQPAGQVEVDGQQRHQPPSPAPISITPHHMRASITGSLEPARRARHHVVGGGSTPIASAGPESVTRLIHRICVASSGSTSAPLSPPRRGR